MSRALLLLFVIVAASSRADAKPSWASRADSRDASGNTFICEGSGATEEAAVSAAHAICNDKICKVCGIEIESIVETKETLRGVDMQRKVVERCRRVRKEEPTVQYKSTDCGPDGCTTWLQVFYSKEAERAECPAYAQENFADPAACERDIEAFKTTTGRSAESFRKRKKHLEDALIHCEKIDVRPTPAIMALDEKLRAGMDYFEFTERKQQDRLETPFFDTTWYKSREEMMRDRGPDDRYLTTYLPLRQQIAESKLLVDRIRLVRDYVANKALVFDVIEAVRAKDRDSPTGMTRLHAAMMRAPKGGQYGAPKVHFGVLFPLYDDESDTTPIADFMMKTYPPESLDAGESFEMAKFLKEDGVITQKEWDYLFKAHSQQSCVHCLRVAIAAPQHGDGEVRTKRFLQALAAVPEKPRLSDRRHILKSLVPLDQPMYVLALESVVPETYRAAFDLALFDELVSRLDYPPIPKEAGPLLERVMKIVEVGPTDKDGKELSRCEVLGRWAERLRKYKLPTAKYESLVCGCLKGELKKTRKYDFPKSDLLELTEKTTISCKK